MTMSEMKDLREVDRVPNWRRSVRDAWDALLTQYEGPKEA
jgi:hypothetical protein